MGSSVNRPSSPYSTSSSNRPSGQINTRPSGNGSYGGSHGGGNHGGGNRPSGGNGGGSNFGGGSSNHNPSGSIKAPHTGPTVGSRSAVNYNSPSGQVNNRPTGNYKPGGNYGGGNKPGGNFKPSDNGGNHKPGGNNGGGNYKPGGNNGGGNYRPGDNNGGSHKPGGDNRPGGNNGGGNYKPGGNNGNNGGGNYRPGDNGGNHKPGGNHGGGNYRPGGNHGNRPGGDMGHRPPAGRPHHGINHGGPRPNYDHYRWHSSFRPRGPRDRWYDYYRYNRWSWVRPIAPPLRPWRPRVIWYYRPVIPVGYRIYASAPIITGVLGLEFGTLLDASLNYLYYNGYSIDGYQDNIVYLRDVNMMGYSWPDVMLQYDNRGGLCYAEFVTSSTYQDDYRYNNIYNNLCTTYGTPINVGNGHYSWYGGNQTGYINLNFSYENGRYYTVMTMGA